MKLDLNIRKDHMTEFPLSVVNTMNKFLVKNDHDKAMLIVTKEELQKGLHVKTLNATIVRSVIAKLNDHNIQVTSTLAQPLDMECTLLRKDIAHTSKSIGL